MAESVGSLLFVTLGLHRQLFRAFAVSLEKLPPGKLAMSARWYEPVVHLLGTLFSTGFRLALPIIALLMMVDITLAMLGRINSQLQLTTLSFSLKMLAALAILTVLLIQLSSLYDQMARPIVDMAMRFARQ
jgi:flagellar biosynthetic protein FliR